MVEPGAMTVMRDPKQGEIDDLRAENVAIKSQLLEAQEHGDTNRTRAQMLASENVRLASILTATDAVIEAAKLWRKCRNGTRPYISECDALEDALQDLARLAAMTGKEK